VVAVEARQRQQVLALFILTQAHTALNFVVVLAAIKTREFVGGQLLQLVFVHWFLCVLQVKLAKPVKESLRKLVIYIVRTVKLLPGDSLSP